MALNALKPLQATMWRPSGVMKFVKTPSRGLAEINQPLAPSKPVGAFRGGLFGFLLGNFVSSVGLYYYVLEDYKVSNELLTNDINKVQTSVQLLEQKILKMKKKFNE